MPNYPNLFRFYRDCETCGGIVESNRKDRRFCDRCLKDRANAATRRKRAAEREVSSAPRKHEVRTCRCGLDFLSSSHNQITCHGCKKRPENDCCIQCGSPRPYRRKKFCEPCAAASARERNAASAEKKLRLSGARTIGSLQSCCDCGGDYVLTAGSMIRCLPCRGLYMNRWQREKRKTSAHAAITDRIRRGINGGLGKGVKRNRKWEALVGYSTADLMEHLERQFLPGMTWENRGLWHVDHIVPLRAFKYEAAECPDFRAAWALANLRPLWKRDNLTKQGRRTHLL